MLKGHHETAVRRRPFAGRVFRNGFATSHTERNPAETLRGALIVPRLKHQAPVRQRLGNKGHDLRHFCARRCDPRAGPHGSRGDRRRRGCAPAGSAGPPGRAPWTPCRRVQRLHRTPGDGRRRCRNVEARAPMLARVTLAYACVVTGFLAAREGGRTRRRPARSRKGTCRGTVGGIVGEQVG